MIVDMTIDDKIAVIEKIADLDDDLSVVCCRKLLADAWEIEKSENRQDVVDFYRAMATFAMMPKPEQQRWLGKLEGKKDHLEKLLSEIKERATSNAR